MDILIFGFKKFKFHSLFLKIMLFFLVLILFSVLLVGYLSYMSSSSILVDEVIKLNMKIINQVRETIDKEVNLIIEESLQVAVDLDSQELFSTKRLSGYLADHYKSRGTNVWIFNKEQNLVLDRLGSYEASSFLDGKYDGDFSTNASRLRFSPFISSGRYAVVRNEESDSVISFYRTIPVSSTEPMGFMVIEEREILFKKLVDIVDTYNPVYTYIVDSTGRIVTSNVDSGYDDINTKITGELIQPELEKINSENNGYFSRGIGEKKYIVAFASSSLIGWKYVSVIPARFIQSRVKNIKDTTILIAVLISIFGAALSLLLSANIYRPINSIVKYINMIRQERGGKSDSGRQEIVKCRDELSLINKVLGNIHSENCNLKNLFHKGLPILREKILTDMLNGTLPTDRLREMGQDVDVSFPYDYFQVIVFEKDNPSEYILHVAESAGEEFYSVMKGCIKQFKCGEMGLFPVREGLKKTILVVNLSEEEVHKGSIYPFIDYVRTHFHKKYGITFTTGIGNPGPGPSCLSHSCQEAKSALKYKLVKGQNQIIHFEEVSHLPVYIFNYSMETEKQIMNLVKAGEDDAVKLMLNDIFRNHLKEHFMSPEMINNLFRSLAATSIRIIYDVQSSPEELFGEDYNIYKKLSILKGIEERIDYMTDVFKKISVFINQSQKKNHERIYKMILCYVEDNYDNNNLSLNQIADDLGFSPSYLSWIFKSLSGRNFLEFIRTLRIQKSKELLRGRREPIEKIAQSVGFISSNTFIKVFKKYEGITPGQFRAAL